MDKLHDDLKAQLKDIKDKVYQELEKLNKDVAERTKEYHEFSQKMEKMLEKFEENKEQLQKDIYTCQDHIEELKRLDENFHKILRKVSFEPSDWTPDARYVYLINFYYDYYKYRYFFINFSYIGTFSCPELFQDDDEDDEDCDMEDEPVQQAVASAN